MGAVQPHRHPRPIPLRYDKLDNSLHYQLAITWPLSASPYKRQDKLPPRRQQLTKLQKTLDPIQPIRLLTHEHQVKMKHCETATLEELQTALEEEKRHTAWMKAEIQAAELMTEEMRRKIEGVL